MSTNFDFDAPQFINFSDLEDLTADKFFDCDKTTENKEIMPENKGNTVKDCNSTSKKVPVLRKILHEIVNQQIQSDKNVDTLNKSVEKDLIQDFEKMQLSHGKTKERKSKAVRATEIFNGVQSSAKKSHAMITRLDTLNEKNLLKSSQKSSDFQSLEDIVIKDSTVSKQVHVKKSTPLPSPKGRKYVSLAEQVEHFLKDTPDRFRSKPRNPISLCRPSRIENICPKTPKLIAKNRCRGVNYPNEQEREEMELEEIRRHKIKANPLNEKILQGPSLNLKAPIIKKPTTIPQPFALTETKKKDQPQKQVYSFKAQPMPKTIFDGPVGIPPKKIFNPTVPTTPQIRIPKRFRSESKTSETYSSTSSLSDRPQKTIIQPFSFDERMKTFLQKREEHIKKVLEEEKKTFNSFRAHPMPSFKSKSDQNLKIVKSASKTVVQPFNLTQPKGKKLFSDDQTPTSQQQRLTPFKARPASVVHQKPFVPKLEKHEILPRSDFCLKTEIRAVERHRFDEKVKQKEEELSLSMQLKKKEEEELEKKKMLEERKKAEFKARPMPEYKVFEIHGADFDRLTLPKSPLFSSRLKKNEKGK